MIASVKMSCYFQKGFLFWKFLSYFVCVPSFKSINSSSLSKKSMRGNFNTIIPPPSPITSSKYVGGNSVNWIRSQFLNIAFYKLFYMYFFVYVCVEQNLWFKKLNRVLHLFGLTWGDIQCYSVKLPVSGALWVRL